MNVVREFVSNKLPELQKDAVAYNIERGKLNARLAQVRSISPSELSEDEINTARRMVRSNQAGLDLNNNLFGFCSCEVCCGPTGTCGRNWRMESWPEAYDTGVMIIYEESEETNG